MKLIPTFATIYFLFASLLVNAQSNPCQFNQNNPLFINARNTPFVCNGFTVTLETSPSEIENAKYQWSLDGIAIPNATNNTFTASKTGNYSLKITQGNCEAISNAKKVYVGELKPVDIYTNSEIFPYKRKYNNNVEMLNGTVLTLQVYNDYLSPQTGIQNGITFQWQKDDIDIPKETDKILYTKEVGTYRLKVSQGECIAFSKSIIVKKGNPKLIKFSSNATLSACEGDSVSNSIKFVPYSLTPSTNPELNGVSELGLSIPTTFKLYKDEKFVKNFSNYNDLKFKETGKYYATADFININKETYIAYTDTIEVVIKGKTAQFKIRSIENKKSTCLDSMSIYAWEPILSPNNKHQWKYNGNILPNEKSSTLIIKKSGSYLLETQTESGCTYISEPFVAEFGKIEVKIADLEGGTVTGRTEIDATNKYGIFCQKDENYIFPSIKTFYDYDKLTSEWFLDGVSIGKNRSQEVTKSGTYSVKLQQGSCTGTASAKIEVIDIPKLISKDSLLICQNGSVNIEAPKLDKYTWLLNNQNFAETQSIKASKIGNYRVWLEKGECGGMSNVVKVLQKNTLPTATISGSKTINFGDSTRIKIDLTDTAPWTVKLSNNQVFITDKTPFEFSVKPSQSTTYELTSVKNECGEGTFAGKAEVKIIILGNEEIAGANIKIFPIPAQNSCQLSVETSLPESLELQLFSLDGKLISKTEKSKVAIAHSQTINLESTPSGTYLLKIMLGSKVVSRKIIKQN